MVVLEFFYDSICKTSRQEVCRGSLRYEIPTRGRSKSVTIQGKRFTVGDRLKPEGEPKMSLDDKARSALEPAKLDLPASPRVLAIEVEIAEDTSGEEALSVYVILPNDVADDSLTGDNVLHLKRAIRSSLTKHGIGLFPYIHLRTQNERKEELAGHVG